ncbi:MAG: MFS transporter [Candidatus Rokubacteria bacterium]|nr:MFS transporter [Candidatus Rokubacteria bacterium]
MRLLWPGAFAFFLSFYLLLSALPLYARAAGVSDRALGFIIGAFALASMLVKPWAGWAADRFGRRPLMLAGASIFLAASLAYSLSGTAVALLLTRLLHGSGMGLYPTAASAVVTDLAPPERRGELLGFFGAAANVAMAIGPLAGLAIAERLGFATLFGVAAGVALVAVLLSAAVGETLQDRRHIPFGVSATLSRSAMFPSLIVLFLMLTYGAQVSFLPLYAHAHGVNPGLFFLVFALVVAVVRGRAGRLSDRLGRVPVTVGGLSLAALALLTLAVRQDLVGLAAAGALYGVGFGSAQPALMAWAVDSVERHDRGRAMGTYYTALELGIAIGAVGSGLAVGVVGFAGTFATAALMAAVGAGLALGGTLRHGRRRA